MFLGFLIGSGRNLSSQSSMPYAHIALMIMLLDSVVCAEVYIYCIKNFCKSLYRQFVVLSRVVR